MKKIISSFAAILFICTIQAQEFSKFKKEDFKKDENYGWFNYLQVTAYKGAHMTSEEYKEVFSEGFYGVGFRLGTQATGRKEWQRLHNYPQYGLGVTFFDLGGTLIDSLIGKPAAFYFFYGAPITRFGDFRLNGDVEIGISHDFNAYDAETNNLQDFIGASSNLHANFSLQLYYELSQRMDISMGLSFMHFSNGRSFTPQKGINLFGLNLSSSYHFNPIKNYTKKVDPDYQPAVRPTFIEEEKSGFKPHHEFTFMASIGTVQAEPGEFKNENGQVDTTGAEGPRYLTNSFTAEYAYQFARKLKVVGGLDMFYDGSAEYLYDDILPQNTTFNDKAFYGYHVGFHYLIERISVIFNYGRYIHKPFPQRGKWFMRAGGRIGLTENLDAHIALKTRNGGIADWIEWGLAYKIKSK
ncbi:acyloxyacyl hydrolase [Draconibacterium sp.]|nr:acyloxyacyl hydrolase [Draconibacterium sp.]